MRDAGNSTMFDWLMHSLHAGETITQVEFLQTPPGSVIPVDRKLRITTAAEYLKMDDAARSHICVNTSNSKDGDRIFFIQKTLCFYCAVRKWMGFIDLREHFQHCPGHSGPHLEAVNDPDKALSEN